MSEQEKIALLEETLELDEGDISPEMNLNDIDGYDSLGKLALVVMFEDEFGKKITSKEIRAFETVRDILEKMEN